MVMVQCKEILPLLEVYQDGELEPAQMQQVARHLAGCAGCESELAATAALGRNLRAVAIEPDLRGFAAGVQQRLAELTPPLHVRAYRYVESLREQIGMALALGAAGLAAAAVTAVLLTPYVSQYASRTNPQVALAPTVQSLAMNSGVEVVERDVSPEMATAVRDDSNAVELPQASVGWSEGTSKVLFVEDQP
jgi:anti-sigma factor RsiW